MSWRPLSQTPDGSPPKLGNLGVAARAGIAVPPTCWIPASEWGGVGRPPGLGDGAIILRSASPTEDGADGSNAGQFHSEVVPDPTSPGALQRALAAVVASLPRDASGTPTGCVFAQPLRTPEWGGVAFFDGFYFERTTAAGGNVDLTSGRSRGQVDRGHVERGDAWSEWLASVHTAFGASGAIDIEFTQDAGPRFELLQVRPAAFAVRRNATLSLANHREILGETPSPWIVSVVACAGRESTSFFTAGDRQAESWREPYAIELAGRAWMNFGFLFRLMDHWGLPRTWITEGVGGTSRGPADARIVWPRFLRSTVPLLRLQWRSWREVLAAPRGLAEFRDRVESATTLRDLFEANVQGMALALRTNFALGGMLSGVARVRSALGVRGRPRVVTAEMMRGYDALRGLPNSDREERLDGWLELHGHRGPLESDPCKPRFAELRDTLLADLARPGAAQGAASDAGSDSFLFALERRREGFRDELMRTWQVLRRRMLRAGADLVSRGELDHPADVFQIRGQDLEAGTADLRAAVGSNRAAAQDAHRIAVPLTAAQDEIERLLRERPGRVAGDVSGVFEGIGLGGSRFEGVVRRAASVESALGDADLGPQSVLLVTALEPSWALVFGRVGAVVAEIGGELSHASILLREAGRPAVVNCDGVGDALRDGQRVVVDPERGTVTRVGDPPA